MQAAPKVETMEKTGTAVAVRSIFSMKVMTPSRRRNKAKGLEADRQISHQLEVEVETQDPVSQKRDHHPAGHTAGKL
jgi:hypothetical protein